MRQKLSEDAQPEIFIIELKKGNNVIRRPIKADSAIMHWHKQVIALKAQSRTLQIFDLETKTKLKSCTMSEDVVFWKWISVDTLALVTDQAIYHWNIYDPAQTQPARLYDRNPNLAGAQIINYRVNEDDKWSVTVGISSQGGRVAGQMQLYSRDRGISQITAEVLYAAKEAVGA